jgi:hypothetical protein
MTRAINERGESLFSDLNTVGGLIQTEPTKMVAPQRDTDPSLTQFALVMNWVALSAPDNGDSEVTTY